METPFSKLTPFFLPIYHQRGKIFHLGTGAIGHLRNGWMSFNFLWVSTWQVRLLCTSIPSSNLEVRMITGEKIGLESSNLKIAFPLILLEGKKYMCDFSNWNGKHKRKRKKMFKVAVSLLVQILKIRLNTHNLIKH